MLVITDVFEHPSFAKLDSYAKLVLLYLFGRRNGKTGQCNPSISRMLRELAISQNTLLGRLKVLEKARFIVRDRGVGGRGCTTQYNLVLPDETPSPEKGVFREGVSRNSFTPCGKTPSPREDRTRKNFKSMSGTLPSTRTGEQEKQWSAHAKVSVEGEHGQYVKRVTNWLNTAPDEWFEELTRDYPRANIEVVGLSNGAVWPPEYAEGYQGEVFAIVGH